MTAASTNLNTSASRRASSKKQLRDLQRAVHLVGGVLVAAYLYTPLRDLYTFGLLIQLVVVPVVVATGMAMWQLPRLGRLLQPRDRAAATACLRTWATDGSSTPRLGSGPGPSTRPTAGPT